MDGMSFTSRVLLSWITLNGTMRAGAQMRSLKEELEVELPLKEEDEEVKEDLFISKARKKTEGVTFRKCKRGS